MSFSVSTSFGSLCSTDHLDDGPLESDIGRPDFFNAHTLLYRKQWLIDVVTYPKGLENTTQIGAGRNEADTAVRAPFPCGSKLTTSASPVSPKTPPANGSTKFPVGRSTSPSFTAPFNPTNEATNQLRIQLGAFVTANGISHLDARCQLHESATILANSIEQELADAKRAAAAAAEAAAGAAAGTVPLQPAVVAGPDGSRRSRSTAVTLLLPTAIPGRNLANSLDLALLDAFALIAQLPLTRLKGVKDIHDEVGKAWPSSSTTTNTIATAVRLAVSAGACDVTDFLTKLRINTKRMDWLRAPSIVVSFLSDDGSVDHKLAQVASDGGDLKACVLALQEAAAALQASTDSLLTLPIGFLDNDLANVALEERATDSTSPFLEFQAELQRRFHELHLPAAFNECPKELSTLRFDANHRFVRVVQRGSHFHEADRQHTIGILLSSHEATLESYLKRCRREEPRRGGGNWPIYSLLPLENEELTAAVSLLWFKIEPCSIGGDLSLFGPRSQIGCRVCEFVNCGIHRVVPSLAPVQRVLDAGYWVCPCTSRSVLPAQGPYALALHTAFESFLETTIERLTNTRMCLPPTLGDDDEDDDRFDRTLPITFADAESRAYLGHILGLHVGHPSTSLSAIYHGLQVDSKNKNTSSSAFRLLVSRGLLRHGGDCNLEFLFRECLEALEGGGRQNDKAASSTNEPPKAEEEPLDDLAHLFADDEARRKLLRLAELSTTPEKVDLVANEDADEEILRVNSIEILKAVWKVTNAGDFDQHIHNNPKFLKTVSKRRNKLMQTAEETWVLVMSLLLAVDLDKRFTLFCYSEHGRAMRCADRSAAKIDNPGIFDVVHTVPTARLLAHSKKPKLLVSIAKDETVVGFSGAAAVSKKRPR